MLIIGLAVGIILIGLGILIIDNESHIGMIAGEDGHYYLLTPNMTAVNAGILMTVIGIITVSVSIVGIAGLWKS